MYSVSVPLARSGYMEYVAESPGATGPGPRMPENLLEDLVGAVGCPEVVRAESVVKVFAPALPGVR